MRYYTALLALLLMAFTGLNAAAQQASRPRDNTFVSEAQCMASLNSGSPRYYTPSDLSRKREPRQGERLVARESDECNRMLVAGGVYRWVVRPAGTNVIYRGTTPVADYECGNPITHVRYPRRPEAPPPASPPVTRTSRLCTPAMVHSFNPGFMATLTPAMSLEGGQVRWTSTLEESNASSVNAVRGVVNGGSAYVAFTQQGGGWTASTQELAALGVMDIAYRTGNHFRGSDWGYAENIFLVPQALWPYVVMKPKFDTYDKLGVYSPEYRRYIAAKGLCPLNVHSFHFDFSRQTPGVGVEVHIDPATGMGHVTSPVLNSLPRRQVP